MVLFIHLYLKCSNAQYFTGEMSMKTAWFYPFQNSQTLNKVLVYFNGKKWSSWNVVHSKRSEFYKASTVATLCCST